VRVEGKSWIQVVPIQTRSIKWTRAAETGVQADYRQIEFDANPSDDLQEFRVQLQLAF